MEQQAHIAGENKGAVETIQEKLPGSHADQQQTTGGTHAGVTGTETHGTGEKKGVPESIKDKLPGGHDDHQHTTGMTGSEAHATTATSDGNYGQPGSEDTGEKKGIMDKIKDKLPGQH